MAPAAAAALKAQLEALDGMYGREERRWLSTSLGIGELPGASPAPFDDAVAAVCAAIRE